MDVEEHRNKIGRRNWDHVYYWMPIILSLITSLLGVSLTLGTLYGKLQGDLKLIDFRLTQIEFKLQHDK